MHRRLAKELPQLRAKTLLNDGLAVEAGSEVEAPAAAASTRPPPARSRSRPTASAADGTRFVALLAGPKGSPYEGGVFRLQVEVPLAYPMEPPKIKFETRLFHPNVGRGHTPGAICLDILRKEAWSPALNLERTLLSIASLLADPNPASPMDGEAAKLYENDRAAYDRRVKDWVRQYAQSVDQVSAWAGDFGKSDDADSGGAGTGAGAESATAASMGTGAGASLAAPPPAPTRATAAVAAASAAGADDGQIPSWARPVVIDLDDSDEDPPPMAKRARG